MFLMVSPLELIKENLLLFLGFTILECALCIIAFYLYHKEYKKVSLLTQRIQSQGEVLLTHNNSLRKKNDSLRKEIKESEDNLKSLQTDVSEGKAQIKTLQVKIIQSDSLISSLEQELKQADAKNSDLQHKLSVISNQCTTTQNALAKEKDKNVHLTTENYHLSSEREKYLSDITSLHSQISVLENARNQKEAQTNRLTCELTAQTQNLESVRKELTKTKTSYIMLKNEYDTLLAEKRKIEMQSTFLQDKLIHFNEEQHTYTVDGKGEMLPVSSVVKKFFRGFNAVAISNIICKYNRIEAEKLREEWEHKAFISTEAGTFLHKMIDNYVKHGTEPLNMTCEIRKEDKYNNIDLEVCVSKEWEYFKEFMHNVSPIPFRTEWSIYDIEAKMAGTIDFLCRKQDGTYELYDWKRSSKISPNEKGRNKGINGLEHLYETQYTEHCLKQNLYRYMLQKNYGIKVSGMNLVLLHPDFTTYRILPVPIMDKEVQVIINYLKEGN